jgi:uncharacterized coiled-coil DUF342 family protein
MSDTPETDSLLEGEGTQCGVDIVKLLNLCRKFERERNDARDTEWAREIHSCHNACAKPICTLRRERDEARKDVRDLMEQYQDHLQYGDEFEDSALIQGICDRLSEWETEQAKPWAEDQ